MPQHVVLLRGINVGGKNLVAMAELRAMATKLGHAEVRTLLQSGNLVLRSDKASGTALEKQLESESARKFKFPVDYFVRTARQWQALVANNPFPKEAQSDPSHLVLALLKAKPTADKIAALQAANRGREVIHAAGQHLYLFYPDGIGRSKLTNALIEQKLGTRATARNWNTVLKLAALVGE